MRSPFPGMDPYLESPTRWAGMCHHLLSAIAETLGDALAPTFIVVVEERVYIASPEDLARLPWIQPDVFVVGTAHRQPAFAGSATITPPLVIETVVEEEIREYFLEIVDTKTRSVVMTIEVLSPINKAARTTGRTQFMEKRQRVLQSQTHWIEIDLLRAGERPSETGNWGDYYMLLHRGGDGTRYSIWRTMLQQRLPIIAVPTLPTLPDTPLDLQAVVDLAYRRGHFDIAIDYGAPVPLPALAPADQAWVQKRLAAWNAQ